MELWNHDTGELLCKNVATYGGQGEPTITGTKFDEPGYLDDHCYSLAEAEKRLLSLKGIGPWTARVFLSKRFGYRALVPLNDVALQRAAAWFIKGEKGKLSPLELEEALSPFGELAGEAAHRILMRWVLETY